jgi:hypothetical protein
MPLRVRFHDDVTGSGDPGGTVCALMNAAVLFSVAVEVDEVVDE